MGTRVNGPGPIPGLDPCPCPYTGPRPHTCPGPVPAAAPLPGVAPRSPTPLSKPSALSQDGSAAASLSLPPPAHLPASSEGWTNGRPLPPQSGAVIGQPTRQSSLGLKPSWLCRVDGPSGGGRARFGGEGQRGPAVPGEGEGCRAGGAAVTAAGGARDLQGPGRWAAGAPRPAAVRGPSGRGCNR